MEKSQGLVVIICTLLFTGMADATQFKVGGSNGWCLPQPNTVSYNQWASMNRFKIGDSLLFTYAQGQESVLLVNQDAYNGCNTSSYIKKYEDGNTIFTFDRSGPFFFISGIQGNCQKNELLHVVVLGDRTKQIANQTSISPSPPPSAPALSPSASRESSPSLSPSASAGSMPPISSVPPPPAGTGEVAPSPGTNEAGTSTAPSGEDNPMSPPEGNADSNPNPNPNPTTPSPSSPPPPNGAPLKVVGLIGSIGPLLALAIFAI